MKEKNLHACQNLTHNLPKFTLSLCYRCTVAHPISNLDTHLQSPNFPVLRSVSTDEKKEAAFRFLSPGWKSITQHNWFPKGTKPTAEQQRVEIKRRSATYEISKQPRPNNWSWTKFIEWLKSQEPKNKHNKILPFSL